MDTHPYHNYLFFQVSKEFYQSPKAQQLAEKEEFGQWLSGVTNSGETIIVPYATQGLKANTTFMFWCRGKSPDAVQPVLSELFRTKFGKYLTITYTYFGAVRNSQYSGRTGKPEQVMQNFDERLPYLIVYPFTKTSSWYLLDHDNRSSMMGQHIKIGLSHPTIRQCLLYSYGVDDYEFVVSYETNTIEEFQDLILEMRKTMGRKYTLKDTPTFLCIYKSPADLMELI